MPDTFGFALSVDFLAMIVIGGLGSIGGAALGAIFVSLLPRMLDHYSGSLPLVADTGGGGLQPSQAARMIYGVCVIAVLLYLPGGLAGLGERLKRRRTRPEKPAAAPSGVRRTSTELKETT